MLCKGVGDTKEGEEQKWKPQMSDHGHFLCLAQEYCRGKFFRGESPRYGSTCYLEQAPLPLQVDNKKLLSVN